MISEGAYNGNDTPIEVFDEPHERKPLNELNE
jgi:hypothetical protein